MLRGLDASPTSDVTRDGTVLSASAGLRAAGTGEMVTLKLTPVSSIISSEVVFTNVEKPYGCLFSVSYQGRESAEAGRESERAGCVPL